MNRSRALFVITSLFVAGILTGVLPASAGVSTSIIAKTARIKNDVTAITVDLRNGRFSGVDLTTGRVMFDYSETAWCRYGGFEDASYTTVSAYRKVFELCREGPGEKAFIHGG